MPKTWLGVWITELGVYIRGRHHVHEVLMCCEVGTLSIRRSVRPAAGSCLLDGHPSTDDRSELKGEYDGKHRDLHQKAPGAELLCPDVHDLMGRRTHLGRPSRNADH